MGLSAHRRDAYLAECRELALEEIHQLVNKESPAYEALYQLVLDYPLRGGKGLRPALCIATSRALGAKLDDVRRTAAVLELYHNAFLVHDDVEDESEERRGQPTLHTEHGVPVAINVGDAMLALSLQPLLDNVEVLGLGAALHTLRSVARMTRESVEGQAIELDWIRHGTWQLTDQHYIDMVVKKTGWYSFITPISLGCLAARADSALRAELEELGRCLSVAFQIQDDVLNLESIDGDAYGKESAGDLWEGKRTLILIHALRSVSDLERARALRILAKARPTQKDQAELERWLATVDGLADIPGHHQQEVKTAYLQFWSQQRKSTDDVATLLDCIQKSNSIEYAAAVARQWSARAAQQFERCAASMAPSVHRDFLESLVNYVHQREL